MDYSKEIAECEKKIEDLYGLIDLYKSKSNEDSFKELFNSEEFKNSIWELDYRDLNLSRIRSYEKYNKALEDLIFNLFKFYSYHVKLQLDSKLSLDFDDGVIRFRCNDIDESYLIDFINKYNIKISVREINQSINDKENRIKDDRNKLLFYKDKGIEVVQ